VSYINLKEESKTIILKHVLIDRYPRVNIKSRRVSNSSPDLLPELSSLAMISDIAAARQPLHTLSSSPPEVPAAEETPAWINSVESQDTAPNVLGEDRELRDTSPAFSTRPPSPKAPTDMIYADIFGDDRKSQPQSQTIFYVGHATHNMSYILSHKGGPVAPFLHYPVLDGLATRKPVSPDEMGFHRARGDYDLPPPKVQDELIRTYFRVVQPTYPVLDRVQFAKSYRNQFSPPSLLLLQAMFMVAATHCPMEILLEAGFKTRHEAKRTFYRRAKGLFDADYEPNRLINIQAAFLLQFWWESPLEQKDTSYWLNLAITLAQGCGMHRCTARSGLSINDRRLWRRIWTSLCVRSHAFISHYYR
jgi:Fungal specific transcription factor domain